MNNFSISLILFLCLFSLCFHGAKIQIFSDIELKFIEVNGYRLLVLMFIGYGLLVLMFIGYRLLVIEVNVYWLWVIGY